MNIQLRSKNVYLTRIDPYTCQNSLFKPTVIHWKVSFANFQMQIAPKPMGLETFNWSQKIFISPTLTLKDLKKAQLNFPWEATVTLWKVSFAHFQMQMAPKPMGLHNFNWSQNCSKLYRLKNSIKLPIESHCNSLICDFCLRLNANSS